MKKKIILFIMLFCLFIPLNIYAEDAVITGSNVQLRKGAGTSYSSLYQVNAGTSLYIDDLTLYSGSGCSNGWYKATYKNKTVYVCSKYVRILDNTFSGITVVDWTARINANNVNARKNATTSSSSVDTLSLGTNVNVISSVTAKNSGCSSNLWYKVSYYQNKTAYVCSNYVTFKENITAIDTEYEQTLLNAGFPSSYIPYLTYLHQIHPNWVFNAKQINHSFQAAVSSEEGLNYMQTTNDYYRTSSTPAEGASWYRINSSVIAFYMDPRNWLTEQRIFMFEKQDYDNTYDEQYPNLIKNVFGSGALSADEYTIPIYTQSKKYGINPLSVASRIRLEVGANGSDSTNGCSFTYEGQTYSGYYNFFNIGAYEKTVNGTKYSSVVMGLVTAKNKGWDTIEKAIEGGVAFLANGYITAGQPTVYYQKFNVSPDARSNFTHQYMTNVQAPATEGNQTYNSYKKASMLNQTFVFEIPVYGNMPAYTSLPMSVDTNNYLSNLQVDGFSISPNFDPEVLTYEVFVPSQTQSVNITATSISNKATITGTGTIELTESQTIATITVTSEVQEQRNYVITIKKALDNNEDDNGGNNTGNNNNNDDNGENNNTGNNNNNDDNGENNNTGNNNNNDNPGENNTGNNNNNDNNDVTDTKTIESILNASGIVVNNNKIDNIKHDTSISEIQNKLTIEGAQNVSFKDQNGTVVSGSSLIATGYTLTITYNDETQNYTFIIIGDTSGDGQISILDLLQVQKHIKGDKRLTSVYLEAADTSKDKDVTILDLLQIQKHIKGDKQL